MTENSDPISADEVVSDSEALATLRKANRQVVREIVEKSQAINKAANEVERRNSRIRELEEQIQSAREEHNKILIKHDKLQNELYKFDDIRKADLAQYDTELEAVRKENNSLKSQLEEYKGVDERNASLSANVLSLETGFRKLQEKLSKKEERFKITEQELTKVAHRRDRLKVERDNWANEAKRVSTHVKLEQQNAAAANRRVDVLLQQLDAFKARLEEIDGSLCAYQDQSSACYWVMILVRYLNVALADLVPSQGTADMVKKVRSMKAEVGSRTMPLPMTPQKRMRTDYGS